MPTVAVAHSASPSGGLALVRGVEEARLRGADLAVLHVVGSLDADRAAAYRAGLDETVRRAMSGGPEVPWQVHLRTAASDAAVADSLLGLLDEIAPDLLVLGARRRSPLGKVFLGSVAQLVLLAANVPVMVVRVGMDVT